MRLRGQPTRKCRQPRAKQIRATSHREPSEPRQLGLQPAAAGAAGRVGRARQTTTAMIDDPVVAVNRGRLRRADRKHQVGRALAQVRAPRRASACKLHRGSPAAARRPSAPGRCARYASASSSPRNSLARRAAVSASCRCFGNRFVDAARGAMHSPHGADTGSRSRPSPSTSTRRPTQRFERVDEAQAAACRAMSWRRCASRTMKSKSLRCASKRPSAADPKTSSVARRRRHGTAPRSHRGGRSAVGRAAADMGALSGCGGVAAIGPAPAPSGNHCPAARCRFSASSRRRISSSGIAGVQSAQP